MHEAHQAAFNNLLNEITLIAHINALQLSRIRPPMSQDLVPKVEYRIRIKLRDEIFTWKATETFPEIDCFCRSAIIRC